jgi:hypothetical protein
MYEYKLCMACIIHQLFLEYKAENKLCLGVHEQKRLNTIDLWVLWSLKLFQIMLQHFGGIIRLNLYCITKRI